MRFVHSPEVRGSDCPYLGGRNVQKVRYDRSGAGSMSWGKTLPTVTPRAMQGRGEVPEGAYVRPVSYDDMVRSSLRF